SSPSPTADRPWSADPCLQVSTSHFSKAFCSGAFTMHATHRPRPSHVSLRSYNAESSTETLPRYSLTDLRPPPNAHAHTRNVEGVAPAPAEYAEWQRQFAFDAEANIARNNRPSVSIVRLHTLI